MPAQVEALSTLVAFNTNVMLSRAQPHLAEDPPAGCAAAVRDDPHYFAVATATEVAPRETPL